MSNEAVVSGLPVAQGRARSVSVLLIGCVLVYGLLEAMILPALSLIQQGIGATPAQAGWIISAMALAGGVATPVVGRLADVRDRRVVFLGVLAIVCVGIALAGLASSVAVFAVGQGLQGVGIGLVPLAIGIVRDTEPPEKLRRTNGLLVGGMAVANAGGVLMAGPILSVLSYPWLYWIALIVLVPLMVLAVLVMPSYPPAVRGRVDWTGAVLLGIGLVALLLGVTFVASTGWTSAPVLGLGAVAVVALAVFVAVERRVVEPLVDLRLGGRTVTIVHLTAFASGVASVGLMIAVPTIVAAPAATGYGLGSTPVVTGLIMFPLGVLGAIVSPLAGRLERLVGSRMVMVLAGVLFLVAGLVMLAGRSDAVVLAVGAGLVGVAVGLGLTQGVNIIALTLPADRVASVSGVAYVLRAVGQAVGAQLAATVMALELTPGMQLPSWNAITWAFLGASAVGALVAAVSFGLPARLTSSR
ncbi:MFS transporter [Prauserella endophytica]|uniref:MFS transporter n=1 Tax=Prauserella endophytica TaxID=1592324 RepID=A0ABY2S4I8_9PSEU|nr:MFS transporter [Prauserella endophytica]TKG70559.1 MFS transporter [Prauserella endophytica]